MVTIRAPASTANLGPGFDCLGAALSCALTVEMRELEPWPEGARKDPALLVSKAAGTVLGEPPNVAFDVTGTFPGGKGLGFSAAEIACGLLIGCVIGERRPDRAELLRLGTPLEGHPDNLAASLYGGLTLVLPDGDVLRFAPSASVRPFILLPHEQLPTSEARAVLPDEVPRRDAVANIARAAGLLAVLTGAISPTRERLLTCTDDSIHQAYRAPLMPRTAEALSALREAGIPAAVSGAGPSIVCLVVGGEEDSTREAAGNLEGWELLELDWDTVGAKILEAS